MSTFDTTLNLLKDGHVFLWYFFDVAIAFAGIAQIVMVAWLLLFYWWIVRRAGLSGLTRFQRILLRSTGYNELKKGVMTISVFAVFVLLTWLWMTIENEHLKLFMVLWIGFPFLIVAGLVRERIDMWPMFKSAAIEATLREANYPS